MVGAKLGIALQINYTLGLNIQHVCTKVIPTPLSLLNPSVQSICKITKIIQNTIY